MFQGIKDITVPIDYTRNMHLIKELSEVMYVNEKSSSSTIQFVLDYYEKAIDAYYEDLNNKKYIFDVRRGFESLFTIEFDYSNMAHLLGMNAHNYEKDNEICELFSKLFVDDDKRKELFFREFSKTILQKFAYLFYEREKDILDIEKNRTIDTKSLNWTRLAYKLFCVLNIGNIGDGIDDCINKTYFYIDANKKNLYMLRKTISLDDNLYILISFSINNTNEPLNPKSVKLVSLDGMIVKNAEYTLRKCYKDIFKEIEHTDVVPIGGAEIVRLDKNAGMDAEVMIP